MHDSSNCPSCRGQPREGGMSDDEFSDFLAACRAELKQKQASFQENISGDRTWSYELDDCSLTIGDKRFAMTPIGTHSAKQQTWLWAWANEEFPKKARNAARGLQRLHNVTGFRVFLCEGID